jgi:hypothetical protein
MLTEEIVELVGDGDEPAPDDPNDRYSWAQLRCWLYVQLIISNTHCWLDHYGIGGQPYLNCSEPSFVTQHSHLSNLMTFLRTKLASGNMQNPTLPHTLRVAYERLSSSLTEAIQQYERNARYSTGDTICTAIDRFVDELRRTPRWHTELAFRARLVEDKCVRAGPYDQVRRKALASYRGRPRELSGFKLAIVKLRSESPHPPVFLSQIVETRRAIEALLKEGSTRLRPNAQEAFREWLEMCRRITHEAERLEVDGCRYLYHIHQATDPTVDTYSVMIQNGGMGGAMLGPILASAESLVAWIVENREYANDERYYVKDRVERGGEEFDSSDIRKTIPKVFISYSWDDEPHKKWTRDFAARLRSEERIDAMLDQWETAPGDKLPEFMERAIRENDYVLIVCTPAYRTKSEQRKGGVGYEGDIITAELFANRNTRKFIPILRVGDMDTAIPSWLSGSYFIDLRGDEYLETQYRDLVGTLHGQREKAPPLGPQSNAPGTIGEAQGKSTNTGKMDSAANAGRVGKTPDGATGAAMNAAPASSWPPIAGEAALKDPHGNVVHLQDYEKKAILALYARFLAGEKLLNGETICQCIAAPKGRLIETISYFEYLGILKDISPAHPLERGTFSAELIQRYASVEKAVLYRIEPSVIAYAREIERQQP